MTISQVCKQLSLAIAAAIFIVISGIGKEQIAVSQTLPTKITAPFSSYYSLVDLGQIPELPIAYGGLTFKPNDPNTIMIGGLASLPNSGIYSVQVTRDSKKHITGFGAASLVAKSPGIGKGGIDAGLTYSPKGDVLLYTTYEDNTIGQIKSGSTGPDQKIDLNTLNIIPSTGALAFVPKHFPGSKRLKITSYTANLFYDTTISRDGSGTYKIATPSKSVKLSGGIDSFVYIKAGNRGFAKNSLLITEYDTNKISAYTIDANGNPIPATRKDFLTALSTHFPTTPSTLGATVDPLTGDVLLSTYFEEVPSKGKILAVRGFCPASGGDDDNNDACEVYD